MTRIQEQLELEADSGAGIGAAPAGPRAGRTGKAVGGPARRTRQRGIVEGRISSGQRTRRTGAHRSFTRPGGPAGLDSDSADAGVP